MDLKSKSGIFVGWSIQDKVIFFGNSNEIDKILVIQFCFITIRNRKFWSLALSTETMAWSVP
jgi:hypothetical protein